MLISFRLEIFQYLQWYTGTLEFTLPKIRRRCRRPKKNTAGMSGLTSILTFLQDLRVLRQVEEPRWVLVKLCRIENLMMMRKEVFWQIVHMHIEVAHTYLHAYILTYLHTYIHTYIDWYIDRHIGTYVQACIHTLIQNTYKPRYTNTFRRTYI